MRWSVILGVTFIVVLIVLFEWPRMKNHPKRDKIAFAGLLLIGWVLSMLDLQNMAGPNTLVEMIFKPISVILEK
ncbi:hypothetical protein [Brevibacillus sp. SYSU BS000544]|uniref:hypothetical protein n=1 Tax=Brevibacillus sp. SYSU BS000544 TaxID=3416443 RepID=UPI003CE50C19